MSHGDYYKVTGLIFLLVAGLHGTRAWLGWELVLNGWSIPIWVSWAAVVILGLLAANGFYHTAKHNIG